MCFLPVINMSQKTVSQLVHKSFHFWHSTTTHTPTHTRTHIWAHTQTWAQTQPLCLWQQTYSFKLKMSFSIITRWMEEIHQNIHSKTLRFEICMDSSSYTHIQTLASTHCQWSQTSSHCPVVILAPIASPGPRCVPQFLGPSGRCLSSADLGKLQALKA